MKLVRSTDNTITVHASHDRSKIGMLVEFRPSPSMAEERVFVMLNHVPTDHYIVMAKTEPTLERMAEAIDAFIVQLSKGRR